MIFLICRHGSRTFYQCWYNTVKGSFLCNDCWNLVDIKCSSSFVLWFWQVSDQKPLGSWTVKQGQTLTCSAVYNSQTKEYVAVSDSKVDTRRMLVLPAVAEPSVPSPTDSLLQWNGVKMNQFLYIQVYKLYFYISIQLKKGENSLFQQACTNCVCVYITFLNCRPAVHQCSVGLVHMVTQFYLI